MSPRVRVFHSTQPGSAVSVCQMLLSTHTGMRVRCLLCAVTRRSRGCTARCAISRSSLPSACSGIGLGSALRLIKGRSAFVPAHTRGPTQSNQKQQQQRTLRSSHWRFLSSLLLATLTLWRSKGAFVSREMQTPHNDPARCALLLVHAQVRGQHSANAVATLELSIAGSACACSAVKGGRAASLSKRRARVCA